MSKRIKSMAGQDGRGKRRWFGVFLAIKLAFVAAVGAMAQSTPTTPQPTYCSVAGCYYSLEEAEASLPAAFLTFQL